MNEMTLQQKETKHRGRILQTTSEFDSLFISFVVRWAHSYINGAVDLALDLFGKRRKAYDKVADKRHGVPFYSIFQQAWEAKAEFTT